jgi:hypothetical protein
MLKLSWVVATATFVILPSCSTSKAAALVLMAHAEKKRKREVEEKKECSRWESRRDAPKRTNMQHRNWLYTSELRRGVMVGEFSRTEGEFRKYFRMSKESFRRLSGVLASYPGLVVEGSDVDVDLKVGATLRYMAGSKVDDLMRIFHLSRSHTYDCVWKCVEAIVNKLGTKPDYSDREWLDGLKRGFEAKVSSSNRSSFFVSYAS